MHNIHHTEGLILDSGDYGESGKYYFIFTRHLGMIVASASGVRKMSSKLRFVLQDLAYVKIDLVAGRDFWRVTSASKTGKLGELTKTSPSFKVAWNIARLLRRLLPGTESNEELFLDLTMGLSYLEKYNEPEDLKNIETVIVLRMLNSLGYIGDWSNLVQSPLSEDVILEMAKHRGRILAQINKTLRETHL
ncbi:DNA repair protein RecO [Candidatus Nomurabacteria bacterium RIFCSPLOWO2_12_FULL_46_14]|uniref:DNA repair protein RecO n=1 Tax=Candidatus Nomurabacteria bacterium RIFCSPLOWO2_12_FULL_46_14 TaxID=1801797 RepID=A0A1F6YCF0_9BACT|nr:MAG: DNA repair protein RecO [Candidatus Nomurabacteria bacterium RIFCSPLOWO2_12_FULL_46_14]